MAMYINFHVLKKTADCSGITLVADLTSGFYPSVLREYFRDDETVASCELSTEQVKNARDAIFREDNEWKASYNLKFIDEAAYSQMQNALTLKIAKHNEDLARFERLALKKDELKALVEELGESTESTEERLLNYVEQQTDWRRECMNDDHEILSYLDKMWTIFEYEVQKWKLKNDKDYHDDYVLSWYID